MFVRRLLTITTAYFSRRLIGIDIIYNIILNMLMVIAWILYEHSSVLLKIECDSNKREFASCNDNLNACYTFLKEIPNCETCRIQPTGCFVSSTNERIYVKYTILCRKILNSFFSYPLKTVLHISRKSDYTASCKLLARDL